MGASTVGSRGVPLERCAPLLLAALAGACLVQRPLPDRPEASPVHEVRRSTHPDGSTRSEWSVRIGAGGRVERDGPEREFFASGRLAAERSFVRGAPAGLWRTWFEDGTPRSEVDFGAPAAPAVCTHRYWHANGQLAAEGQGLGGVREGPWRYFDPQGRLTRAGSYRAGRRDGPWSFHVEGQRRAEGRYSAGTRVGEWTLWDEDGVGHARPAAEVELPEP